MPKPITATLAGLGIALTLASCGETGNEAVMADTAVVADPVAGAGDEASMILDGRIVSTGPTSFLLDYGIDTITVEVDDWDAFPEAVALNPGDRVTVSGRIDADIALAKTLEASSVYVHSVGTAFYAASVDEEEATVDTMYVFEPRNVDVTGRVTGISGREFTLGPAAGNLRIDTADLPDDPFDDQGRPKVEVGDRVYVWGDLILAASETELRAEGIVSLSEGSRQSGPTAATSGNMTGDNVAEGNSAGAQNNQT